MKILKKVLVSLLVILVLIQFYSPEKNNSEIRNVAAFEQETKVTPQVKTILENKCYSCHSNKTDYPWYSNISPVSIWINNHVEEGKEHFDVSSWANYSLKKKDHKIEELIEEVEENKMPLKSFNIMHGGFSEEEKEIIITWAKKYRESIN